MMRVPIMAGAVLLAVMVALAGCSEGTATSAAPGGGSVAEPSAEGVAGAGGGQSAACELLAPGDIEGVVGNPVADGDGMTRSDCSWGADPDATSVAVLLLSVSQSGCDSSLGADDAQKPVDGLGMPAYWTWVGVSGGVGSLSLCTTAQMVTVTVSAGLEDTPDESSILDQARTLAQLVVTRL